MLSINASLIKFSHLYYFVHYQFLKIFQFILSHSSSKSDWSVYLIEILSGTPGQFEEL
jgi:hypothetical protein